MYLFIILMLLLRGKSLSVIRSTSFDERDSLSWVIFFYLAKSKVSLLLKLVVPLFDYKLKSVNLRNRCHKLKTSLEKKDSTVRRCTCYMSSP